MKGGKGGRKRRASVPAGARTAKGKKAPARRPANAAPKKGSRKKDFGPREVEP